jgi:hypothetical protein
VTRCALPPFAMSALAWNACCSRRPNSAVHFPPSSPPMRSGGASSGGGEASIDDTEGASDERAGDPALAGSGAARQVRKQEEAHRMLHRPDRPGPSVGR